MNLSNSINLKSTGDIVRIFISYSNPDLVAVRTLSAQLSLVGDTYFWNKNVFPGVVDLEQVCNWIENADIVIALINGNTILRADLFENEITYAKAHNKLILPLILGNIPFSEMGFLNDLICHKIDILNPLPSIIDIISFLTESKEYIKLEKENLAIILITLAFLITKTIQ